MTYNKSFQLKLKALKLSYQGYQASAKLIKKANRYLYF